MRRPVQCEGVERGPQRAVQVGTIAVVQPQFLGDVWNYVKPRLPALVDALI